MYLNSNSSREPGKVVGFRDAPVTEGDLVAAFRLAFPDSEPEIIARDFLTATRERDLVWPDDVLALIAMLSPEHEQRIRRYTGWSAEEFEDLAEVVRSRLPDSNAS